MNTNTGGPAFPTLNEHQAGNHLWHYEGMTLRDYFAAKAMQSAVARTGLYDFDSTDASKAYEVADSMLKAREA